MRTASSDFRIRFTAPSRAETRVCIDLVSVTGDVDRAFDSHMYTHRKGTWAAVDITSNKKNCFFFNGIL